MDRFFVLFHTVAACDPYWSYVISIWILLFHWFVKFSHSHTDAIINKGILVRVPEVKTLELRFPLTWIPKHHLHLIHFFCPLPKGACSMLFLACSSWLSVNISVSCINGTAWQLPYCLQVYRLTVYKQPTNAGNSNVISNIFIFFMLTLNTLCSRPGF